MKKTIIIFVIAVVTLAVSGAALAGDLCSAPVETAAGMVAGAAEDGSDTCVWRGIPYAAAPVDELRWMAPQPTPAWTGVRDASRFGDRCVQAGGLMGGAGAEGVGMSEDCLNLNVWRPAKSGTFPVMVWVHGGGYYTGAGSDPGYWGDRLAAAGDVIVVTINYRLSILGFLAHPDLRKNDPNQSTGGYGTIDQAAALRWVHENIQAFGGDPDNVTIFGQSAGGCSVCSLLATPLAEGLFARAIMQSGICELSRDLEDGYQQARGIMDSVKCDYHDLECMRQIPAENLVAEAGGELFDGFIWVPTHDGHVLTDTPLATIRAGDYNHADLLAGTVLDEFGKAVKLKPKFYYTLPANYEKKLVKQFHMSADDACRLTQLYPAENYAGRPVEAMGRAFGADATMQCPTHRLLEAMADDGHKAWFFRFDYHGMKMGKYLGSFHTAELPFLFDAFDRAPSTTFYDEDQAADTRELTRIMQAYWTNFAKTGDPNGPGLPEWAAFHNERQLIQVLDTDRVETAPAGVQQRCEFWDGYGGEFLPFANDLVHKIF